MEVFASELDLLTAFSQAVLALDPDIILGWEIQQGSVGYLVDRAALLEMPLLRAVSRTPEVPSSPLHTQSSCQEDLSWSKGGPLELVTV